MSLEDLSKQEIYKLQRLLLDQVPIDGSAIGNTKLRAKLGWNEDQYWAIRNQLVENGFIEVWRGKEGSIRGVPTLPKIEPVKPVIPVRQLHTTPAPAIQEYDSFQKEDQLYEPIATVLRTQWAKEQGFDAFSVEITARQGTRQTGGKWTRPDVTVVGYKTFPYVSGRFLEVVTFEIKPFSNVDVSSVYEALAHRRAATRSYVVLHVPENYETQMESTVDAIREEAKRHGIGVIVAATPNNFDDWDTTDAERFEPDPSRLNDFIAQQLSDDLKKQIIKWIKQ